MVYSTCSFNPLENEAVLAAALTLAKGNIRTVDVRNQVSPHLKYREGLTSWKVIHKKGSSHEDGYDWFTKYEDVPENYRKQIKKSMFTAPYTTTNNDKSQS
jgi:16S rRNA C967 or C1407 C5-methylase (RsmB/RsmF family)